ncbi:pilus assembly protein PilP [Polyangium spumosum]|uniref:Pilus assembly protein PilP n=1 Tax=Polyangium spumosum TaxID=889282 RepID=A0A6N7Q1J1_9BACT|nr:pilus assembly protein PilP [Polyangium spumosum]
MPPPSAKPPPGAGLDAGVGADGGARAPKAAASAELPQREFGEVDFTETEKNRDPFRGFASVFAQQAKGRTVVQRQVVIERYALDELELKGIVTRSQPRALFTDPANVGWVVKVGDYVGKPEIVRTGGPAGIDVAINWRVDRIRDGDVVFVREDPAHPEIAPVTRVIALFPTENANNEGRR